MPRQAVRIGPEHPTRSLVGIRYYTRIGRRSGISMPWWLAIFVYSVWAALVAGLAVLAVAAAAGADSERSDLTHG